MSLSVDPHTIHKQKWREKKNQRENTQSQFIHGQALNIANMKTNFRMENKTYIIFKVQKNEKNWKMFNIDKSFLNESSWANGSF